MDPPLRVGRIDEGQVLFVAAHRDPVVRSQEEEVGRHGKRGPNQGGLRVPVGGNGGARPNG